MDAADRGYSRLVAWLKIILPLVALAILSTLFLVSRKIDPTNAIPFADVDVEQLTREHRIGKPVFSTMSEGGSAVTVTADRAVPVDGDTQKIEAFAITATIEADNGSVVTVTAPNGRVDATQDLAELSNGVVIDTSRGYHIETDTLHGKMDLTHLESVDRITATGPLGQLEAGKMALTQQSGDGSTDGYVLFFTDGVKVIYVPQE